MEAYRIDRFGSVDGIALRSSEDPWPGRKEVLTRVRATSLNYRGLMVLKGGGRPRLRSREAQRPYWIRNATGLLRETSPAHSQPHRGRACSGFCSELLVMNIRVARGGVQSIRAARS